VSACGAEHDLPMVRCTLSVPQMNSLAPQNVPR
jgi:hypothetical protein